MGIEDQLVVEESTEPPICGHAHAVHDSLPGHNDQGTSTTTTAAIPPTTSSVTGSPNPTPSEKAASSLADEGYIEPHTLTVEDLEQRLKTDVQNGLDGGEAARRLQEDGPNKVEGAQGLSMWKILLRQVSNSLTMVLILVMALSFAINDYIEGGVIAAVILLNIVVGYVEYYVPRFATSTSE